MDVEKLKHKLDSFVNKIRLGAGKNFTSNDYAKELNLYL